MGLARVCNTGTLWANFTFILLLCSVLVEVQGRATGGTIPPILRQTISLGRNMVTRNMLRFLRSTSIPGKPGVDYPVHSAIPETSFDCKQQGFPGYYADTETRCQVFHVCIHNRAKLSLLCPNGTIFNQEHLACDWWFQVDCDKARNFYHMNEAAAEQLKLLSTSDNNGHLPDGRRSPVRSQRAFITNSTPSDFASLNPRDSSNGNGAKESTAHAETENPSATLQNANRRSYLRYRTLSNKVRRRGSFPQNRHLSRAAVSEPTPILQVESIREYPEDKSNPVSLDTAVPAINQTINNTQQEVLQPAESQYPAQREKYTFIHPKVRDASYLPPKQHHREPSQLNNDEKKNSDVETVDNRPDGSDVIPSKEEASYATTNRYATDSENFESAASDSSVLPDTLNPTINEEVGSPNTYQQVVSDINTSDDSNAHHAYIPPHTGMLQKKGVPNYALTQDSGNFASSQFAQSTPANSATEADSSYNLSTNRGSNILSTTNNEDPNIRRNSLNQNRDSFNLDRNSNSENSSGFPDNREFDETFNNSKYGPHGVAGNRNLSVTTGSQDNVRNYIPPPGPLSKDKNNSSGSNQIPLELASDIREYNIRPTFPNLNPDSFNRDSTQLIASDFSSEGTSGLPSEFVKVTSNNFEYRTEEAPVNDDPSVASGSEDNLRKYIPPQDPAYKNSNILSSGLNLVSPTNNREYNARPTAPEQNVGSFPQENFHSSSIDSASKETSISSENKAMDQTNDSSIYRPGDVVVSEYQPVRTDSQDSLKNYIPPQAPRSQENYSPSTNSGLDSLSSNNNRESSSRPILSNLNSDPNNRGNLPLSSSDHTFDSTSDLSDKNEFHGISSEKYRPDEVLSSDDTSAQPDIQDNLKIYIPPPAPEDNIVSLDETYAYTTVSPYVSSQEIHGLKNSKDGKSKQDHAEGYQPTLNAVKKGDTHVIFIPNEEEKFHATNNQMSHGNNFEHANTVGRDDTSKQPMTNEANTRILSVDTEQTEGGISTKLLEGTVQHGSEQDVSSEAKYLPPLVNPPSIHLQPPPREEIVGSLVIPNPQIAAEEGNTHPLQIKNLSVSSMAEGFPEDNETSVGPISSFQESTSVKDKDESFDQKKPSDLSPIPTIFPDGTSSFPDVPSEVYTSQDEQSINANFAITFNGQQGNYQQITAENNENTETKEQNSSVTGQTSPEGSFETKNEDGGYFYNKPSPSIALDGGLPEAVHHYPSAPSYSTGDHQSLSESYGPVTDFYQETNDEVDSDTDYSNDNTFTTNNYNSEFDLTTPTYLRPPQISDNDHLVGPQSTHLHIKPQISSASINSHYNKTLQLHPYGDTHSILTPIFREDIIRDKVPNQPHAGSVNRTPETLIGPQHDFQVKKHPDTPADTPESHSGYSYQKPFSIPQSVVSPHQSYTTQDTLSQSSLGNQINQAKFTNEPFNYQENTDLHSSVDSNSGARLKDEQTSPESSVSYAPGNVPQSEAQNDGYLYQKPANSLHGIDPSVRISDIRTTLFQFNERETSTWYPQDITTVDVFSTKLESFGTEVPTTTKNKLEPSFSNNNQPANNLGYDYASSSSGDTRRKYGLDTIAGSGLANNNVKTQPSETFDPREKIVGNSQDVHESATHMKDSPDIGYKYPVPAIKGVSTQTFQEHTIQTKPYGNSEDFVKTDQPVFQRQGALSTTVSDSTTNSYSTDSQASVEPSLQFKYGEESNKEEGYTYHAPETFAPTGHDETQHLTSTNVRNDSRTPDNVVAFSKHGSEYPTGHIHISAADLLQETTPTYVYEDYTDDIASYTTHSHIPQDYVFAGDSSGNDDIATTQPKSEEVFVASSPSPLHSSGNFQSSQQYTAGQQSSSQNPAIIADLSYLPVLS